MASKVHIRECSKGFLEGMAKALARTIDSGQTHNADGILLASILDEVIAYLPEAPDYEIEGRRRW